MVAIETFIATISLSLHLHINCPLKQLIVDRPVVIAEPIHFLCTCTCSHSEYVCDIIFHYKYKQPIMKLILYFTHLQLKQPI